MKSVVVKQPGGLDKLAIIESNDPQPAAGEVLVRWHATSLNFHDYLVAIGGIPVPDGRIPMSDGAGEVVAIGEGVSKWKEGDKVMSLFFPNWIEGKASLAKTRSISGESFDGYITEMSCISQEAISRIPDTYSYAEAATLPCAALTAWRGLMEEGNLTAGESVLIEGSGGMSIFGMQLALAAGARVFATTSSEEKAERLKSLGAEAVVNYKEDSRWGKTLFKMTGGIDHVLDVGGGSTMVQSIEAAAIGGHVVSIGILGGGRKGEITFPKLFFKHIKVSGIAVGSRVMQERMVKAINQSGFKPIIDKSFSFDQLADAFRHQESGKHFGKIVLEY
ncbi:MAG: NAD(P)-dependent alcohol dehydrogenase [Bacteroidia bacterium]|nr:NAD(P)-dependent alcohol dehydrogenase [Bacteroidia bacterium]